MLLLWMGWSPQERLSQIQVGPPQSSLCTRQRTRATRIDDTRTVCSVFKETAVARKRSRSFCQKCRWQVTAKHAYTIRMWLCMKRHGAWLYGVHRTCAETAAVSCGTSHASAVSTPLRWILKKHAIKRESL